MARRLIITPAARKDIDRLDKQTRTRVKDKLRYYLNLADPLSVASPLVGAELVGSYRWRVGHYRIIFEVKHDAYIIYRIWHRREVYR